ncbi:TraB/GumN family protein [Qipengyuania vesicularis]|uniref:TraB/GumN family protein n=1 Tax=Qipengyuania vesicularis TaxID=2867232 RepID=UPI001C87A43B|nr:TraB/GumN family protein [Qipengyuania vesicularis]MBX7526743.1 TraB/GumN family protein [Qipengyuania vesicularis]
MKRLISRYCAALALAFAPATPALPQEQAQSQNLGAAALSQDAGTGEGPALWAVADEDTTIYLFGTIHLLPRNVTWYNEPIERALASSDMLMTEIPADAGKSPAAQASIMRRAALGGGRTLRSLLGTGQRKTYERALARLGIPAPAFDGYKPWFVGINLSLLPLIQAGYDPNSGVEEVLEVLAGPEMDRGALETMDEQIGMLDNLPLASQIEMMISSAEDPARMVASVDEMVNFWRAGDTAKLVKLLNEEMTDPVLAKALLYDRNQRWAEWIDARMNRPGVVFIAVGSAHLAGEKSVQDFLARKGNVITRIQ